MYVSLLEIAFYKFNRNDFSYQQEALEESIQVLWHAADQKNVDLIIDVDPSNVIFQFSFYNLR